MAGDEARCADAVLAVTCNDNIVVEVRVVAPIVHLTDRGGEGNSRYGKVVYIASARQPTLKPAASQYQLSCVLYQLLPSSLSKPCDAP